jgi:hypothetical protein
MVEVVEVVLKHQVDQEVRLGLEHLRVDKLVH